LVNNAQIFVSCNLGEMACPHRTNLTCAPKVFLRARMSTAWSTQPLMIVPLIALFVCCTNYANRQASNIGSIPSQKIRGEQSRARWPKIPITLWGYWSGF